MARIAGVNLPQQAAEIGLTYIFGIGRPTANTSAGRAGLSARHQGPRPDRGRGRKLRDAIDHELQVEGDLRRERTQAIKRLSEIGCYRGLRHRRGLPVRGQKTKTNARTRKGPKKMQVAGKKKAGKK